MAVAGGLGEASGVRSRRRCRRPVVVERSSFAGYRFPPEVILLAVRWYLRFGVSYRDVEELLAERGIDVDHVTIFRWVQRFTPGVDRCGAPVPACRRRLLVRRRDLRARRRHLAIRLSGR